MASAQAEGTGEASRRECDKGLTFRRHGEPASYLYLAGAALLDVHHEAGCACPKSLRA